MALLLGALGMLFGCAAPAPPRPPSATPPAAPQQANNGKRESAGSRSMASPASDTSGPAAPQGVEAIAVRHSSGSLEVDLSWAISDAGNLAGYNVYRSQQPGERGMRLNPRVLPVPEFRDTTVSAGVTYRYSVTAVSAAGHESAPSAPVTVNVPGSGQGSP